MHGNGMMDWGWRMHGLDRISMLLGWGFAILGIVAAARWLLSRGSGGGAPQSALDVLKKRCARGESTREELERMKRDLE
jgi:uncharacterized membrane protein